MRGFRLRPLLLSKRISDQTLMYNRRGKVRCNWSIIDENNQVLPVIINMPRKWNYPHIRFFSTTSTSTGGKIGNNNNNNDNIEEEENDDEYVDLLYSEWINPERVTDTTSPIVFLHGLLGNTRNIRTMAKNICDIKQTPGIMFDITGHGNSPPGRYFDSMGNNITTFNDVVRTIHVTIEETISDVDHITLIGHSLGGRLSLLYGSKENLYPRPNHIWLLDTVPSIPDKSVVTVLHAANDIIHNNDNNKYKIKSRKDLITILQKEKKLSVATAHWLALQYDIKKQKFKFDVDTAEALINNFNNQHFWEQLESCHEQNIAVHMIIAGKNKEWKNILPRIEELSSSKSLPPNLFTYHILPDSGHWVHIDDLPGLLNAIKSQVH